jgi:penicillin-binding protein 2
MRLAAFRIIIFVLFVFLMLGLFVTQGFRGGYFYRLGERNTIRLISQEPYRGRIFDRVHRLMVDNILSFDVVVIPQELRHRSGVFEKLAGLLGMTKVELARKYELGYLNPFTPVLIAANVSKETAIILEESSLDMPGVRVQLNARRYYPYGSTAAHLLGYTGEISKSRITKMKEYGYDLKDKVGYTGLEEKYDLFLRGEKGGEQIEVDAAGRQVRLLGYKPSRTGKDIETTIDLELQEVSDKLLQGKTGAVILMDSKNGEILVMSSAPSFDPNVFIERKDPKVLNDYLTSTEATLVNRAVMAQAPPGSVFKVVTAAAALKNKKFPSSMSFDCAGKLRVGDRNFKCWFTHGSQDFFHAMAHSCDVYFYHLGFWGGSDHMSQMAREFGLGAPTGIDLPQEAVGFIPTRLWKTLKRLETWYDGDTANFSIGQGYVLTTPIQLARLMAAFGNGGFLVAPHLVRVIGGQAVAPPALKKVDVAQDSLRLIKESLRYPVLFDTGTAHNMEIPGLEIGAKTGTAQVAGKLSHGWVAGFFPLKEPRYAFCIFLEHVGSSHDACELGQALFEEGVRRNKFL